jgi:Na+/H+-dicarboxylate symporter
VKESTRVLVALGVGLAGGAAVAASGDPALVRAVDRLAPIGTIWVNAIRMTVIPLVVSLIITAIASVTEVRAVSRLGGRTVLVFLALLTGTAVLVIPLVPLAFRLLPFGPSRSLPLPAGAGVAARQVATSAAPTGFGAWLTTLVPTNPIAAAAEGAMLPLIVFVLILALAIGRSPPQSRDSLLGFFRALADAMLVMVRWVVALAPIGVVGLIAPLAAHGGSGLAGAVGLYILLYAVASLAVTFLLYPVVAVLTRIPIRRFARAALPAQLIAFSTSSSIAALPLLVEGAERDLELPDRVTGFVLPLAVSTFKIAGPVSWTVGALFIGWFYGVPLGGQALATIGLAAVFLAFAAPGVPRGAFLMLTPLFLAIGLPAEGIGILIAVDAIPDLFSTVLNTTGNLAAAALTARTRSARP